MRIAHVHNLKNCFGVGMKKGGKKSLLLIAVLFAVCGGSYRIGRAIFGSKEYSFSLDPQLSADMHKSIKDAVLESYFGSLALLGGLIQNVCPAAGVISIERCGNNVLHVSCKSETPYLLLADQFVLLKNEKIVEKKCFARMAIQHLAMIDIKNMHGQMVFSSEFKQWLLQLDESIFQNYAISWADDYEIYLTDKNDAHKNIICSVSNSIDESIREKCRQIIDEKGINAQGTARYCSADIRFEKQIIICSQKGGACHG